MNKKKIVFLTGTRADFGKLQPLIRAVEQAPEFEAHIFATGMHLLPRYGVTVHEILNCGFRNIYLYNNETFTPGMDVSLANTIYGFTSYVKELAPDLIVIHGDRPEALAGAIVGAFNNIRVGHVEGGELSGTIDGLIRHSVTKLSHLHFVANREAQERLRQLGECADAIFEIGSPEVDLILSDALPELAAAKKHYDIAYDEYAILIYHPVTMELDRLAGNINAVTDACAGSDLNYIVVGPNNDSGVEIITRAYARLRGNPRFTVLSSIRFEYFLTLLKHSRFIIGNSSTGVREAPCFGVPSINLGTRQLKRSALASIADVREEAGQIGQAIARLAGQPRRFPPVFTFGDGKSAARFMQLLRGEAVWSLPLEKQFEDQPRG